MSETTYGQQAAAWFNETHPIGTEVIAFPGSKEGRALQRRTRSAAWVLGSDEPVVAIEGYAGGIALSHIVCAEHATHAEATR